MFCHTQKCICHFDKFARIVYVFIYLPYRTAIWATQSKYKALNGFTGHLVTRTIDCIKHNLITWDIHIVHCEWDALGFKKEIGWTKPLTKNVTIHSCVYFLYSVRINMFESQTMKMFGCTIWKALDINRAKKMFRLGANIVRLHTEAICDVKHLNMQEKCLARILVFTRVKPRT